MSNDIKLVGGTIKYKALNTKLSEKDYAVHKAMVWVGMLGKGQKPVHWRKPSKQGTTVEIEFFNTQEAYDRALLEIESYLHTVNTLHGTDLKLTRTQEAANQ